MALRRLALVGAVLASAVASAPAWGQDVAPASAAEAKPVVEVLPGMIRLVALTPIQFEFVTALSSRTSRNDEMFPIRLVAPIRVGDRIVVPAGAMGEGQVIQAAKSGWGGKAGELVVTVRYIEYGGVRIPLRRFRIGPPDGGGPAIGKDNRDTAFAMGVIVSPLLVFAVSGGEKTVVPGTLGNAIVAADTDVPMPADAVPDSK
jgi:hypothetical protein